MYTVDCFELIGRDAYYDNASNPKLFDVGRLLPIKVRWQSIGGARAIENFHGIIGLALSDLSGVAVIEAPYAPEINNSYIVNADGSIRGAICNQSKFGRIIFYEILYSGGCLEFLGATSNGDVRVSVREADGLVTAVSMIR